MTELTFKSTLSGSESGAQIALRRGADRGHVNLGWLDSHHSFSFGGYQDAEQMGFGVLRVINEDRVAPAGGFQEHPHRDMEIISYVIDGALGHRDSTGGGGVIRAGEVQVMSAGHGIRHSEMNGSDTESVHFLQIWVLPAAKSTEPGYAQKDFGRTPGVTLLTSPDGRDGSLRIGQDVRMHRVLYPTGGSAEVPVEGTRAWVQVVRGSVKVLGATLEAGDGAAVWNASSLSLELPADAEAVVMDLP